MKQKNNIILYRPEFCWLFLVAAKINISIYNQFGQKLQNNNYKLSAGSHKVKLNIVDLPAGIYFVSITIEDNVKVVRKFVKTK